MINTRLDYTGLTHEEVNLFRQKTGYNVLDSKTHRNFLHILRGIVTEPMFLLLTAACIIYFITSAYMEGFVMFGAILIVSGISLFQELRSENALNALKKLTEPNAKVIRKGEISEIPTEEIVFGIKSLF
ncbi:MAG: hypothetical protein KFF73_11000 [Cyclobacteriaceae bacterium]|nr:hypothetical protein [Cyclobacteriaceae bacterium]